MLPVLLLFQDAVVGPGLGHIFLHLNVLLIILKDICPNDYSHLFFPAVFNQVWWTLWKPGEMNNPCNHLKCALILCARLHRLAPCVFSKLKSQGCMFFLIKEKSRWCCFFFTVVVKSCKTPKPRTVCESRQWPSLFIVSKLILYERVE